MKRHAWFVGGLLVSAVGFACTSTSGAHPDDMSAANHRAHAAAEDKEAQAHAAQYNPNALAPQSVQGGPGYWEVIEYNPTNVHAVEAADHREHAEAHRKAAAELEKFEEAGCKSFPPETRKLCPLLGTVESAEAIDDGISMKISTQLKREAVLAHVRCHLAFARTEGHNGVPGCPLYLAGVTAKAGADGQTIELRLKDDEQLDELRKRTHNHVAS